MKKTTYLRFAGCGALVNALTSETPDAKFFRENPNRNFLIRYATHEERKEQYFLHVAEHGRPPPALAPEMDLAVVVRQLESGVRARGFIQYRRAQNFGSYTESQCKIEYFKVADEVPGLNRLILLAQLRRGGAC